MTAEQWWDQFRHLTTAQARLVCRSPNICLTEVDESERKTVVCPPCARKLDCPVGRLRPR